MENKEEQVIKTINVINRMNAFAVDGNSLVIQKNGQTELNFFQIIPNSGNGKDMIDASMVASVRMPFEQLEQLSNVLSKAIADQKDKIKK